MSYISDHGSRPAHPSRVSSKPTFRTVGSLLPKLTKPVFEKYGFSITSIITEWTVIVGQDLANFTQPEKLKWNRQKADAHGENFNSSNLTGKSGVLDGATLVLRVDGPRAIEVQFQSEQIIERINCFFGYKAVTEIRILQAPLSKNENSKQFPPPLRPASGVTGLKEIRDKHLRLALARMASGVKREQTARN